MCVRNGDGSGGPHSGDPSSILFSSSPQTVVMKSENDKDIWNLSVQEDCFPIKAPCI